MDDPTPNHKDWDGDRRLSPRVPVVRVTYTDKEGRDSPLFKEILKSEELRFYPRLLSPMNVKG